MPLPFRSALPALAALALVSAAPAPAEEKKRTTPAAAAAPAAATCAEVTVAVTGRRPRVTVGAWT